MLSRGDVVLISFPFTDLTAVKVRPALVLSNAEYNAHSNDVIVCLITSNILRRGFYLIKIDALHPDFKSAGFRAPSVILAEKVHALHKTLIKRRLGSVGSDTINKVQDFLREVILN